MVNNKLSCNYCRMCTPNELSIGINFHSNAPHMQSDSSEKIMKTKKQFCTVKSNVFNRFKRANPNKDLTPCAKFKRWQFVENVKIFKNRVTPDLCVGSFHEAIKPVLLIGQIFGCLPVANVTDSSPSSLKFYWKSFRTIFAFFTTFSCGFQAFLTIYWTFSKRIEFGKMVFLVFYVTNFLSFVCFFKLAKIWPMLMVIFIKT